MAEERINRKLAAILAAVVVGYSRLMASDEAGTLAALKRHRQMVFEPAVAAHQGRIVKLIGDGTIVEFASVVDAVNCALSVQRSEETLQDESLHQPRIVLRIGINLGDVIIEGDDRRRSQEGTVIELAVNADVAPRREITSRPRAGRSDASLDRD